MALYEIQYDSIHFLITWLIENAKEKALTAKEIADSCGLPLSSVEILLKKLVEASLVTESN